VTFGAADWRHVPILVTLGAVTALTGAICLFW
jgi:hypothetical protein